jgi:hypothetical protein
MRHETTRTERLKEGPYRVLLVHPYLGFNTPRGKLSVEPDLQHHENAAGRRPGTAGKTYLPQGSRSH